MSSCCCPVPVAGPSLPVPPPPVSEPKYSQKPAADRNWIKILEIVSTVAIAAFAAYANLYLFAFFITVGALYQFAKIIYNVKQEGLGTQRPGCGQGFGELLSQLKLLSPEIVLATAYVAWRHLAHDPKGFVPFAGFFIGMGITHHTMNPLKA